VVRSTRQTRAAARAVAVLAVLLGLLGMHGLASTHHAAAAPAAAVDQIPHVADTTNDDSGHAAQNHPETSGTSSHLVLPQAAAGPSGSEDCNQCTGGAVVLCLAVLAAVATLVLGLARGYRRAHAAVRPAPQERLGGPPAPRRPPDLVAELCVSRT
jgi:hypothetical protein